MGKSRAEPVLTFLLTLSVAVAGTRWYRPYIYAHGIQDFHVADSFPNFISVPVVYTCGRMICRFLGKEMPSDRVVFMGIFCGDLLYEVLELPHFDIFDILATVVGIAVTYLFIRLFRDGTFSSP